MTLIRDFSPDIVCLNETFLCSTSNFRVPGFSIFREDRVDGWGGVALMVKNRISCCRISLANARFPRDFQAIVFEFEQFNNPCSVQPPKY